jgi:hypothetical protein
MSAGWFRGPLRPFILQWSQSHSSSHKEMRLQRLKIAAKITGVKIFEQFFKFVGDSPVDLFLNPDSGRFSFEHFVETRRYFGVDHLFNRLSIETLKIKSECYTCCYWTFLVSTFNLKRCFSFVIFLICEKMYKSKTCCLSFLEAVVFPLKSMSNSLENISER